MPALNQISVSEGESTIYVSCLFVRQVEEAASGAEQLGLQRLVVEVRHQRVDNLKDPRNEEDVLEPCVEGLSMSRRRAPGMCGRR